MTHTAGTTNADPDFSRAVVDELYRRRPYSLAITGLLAVTLGALGAHRFYCGRFWSAMAMLLTAGGGLLWWIWDVFHLRSLVVLANERQLSREAAGFPPRGMDFMPRRSELRLDEPPPWAVRRSSKARVVASAVMLTGLGLALGGTTALTRSWEPAVVLTLFMAISLIAARSKTLAKVPVLGALIRWVHRLRLFYHHVDPGSVTSLALRPIFGIFWAPWRPSTRAEIRLHLQMGGIVVLALAVFDAIEVLRSATLAAGLIALLAELAQTLVFTYLFVAPASALLTTQLLLSRRDRLVQTLSLLTLVSMVVGFVLASG